MLHPYKNKSLLIFSLTSLLLFSSFFVGDEQVHYQNGLRSLQSKNFVKAIGDFTHAISIDPNFADAYYQRAISKDLLGRQVGFSSSELCYDLIQSIALGNDGAVDLLLKKATAECHSIQTAFFEPSMVFCADFSSEVINRLPQKSEELTVVINLNLYNNKFTEIGAEFTQFQYLMDLNLSSNNIKNVGNNLAALKSLVHLDLAKNQIEILPKSISALQKLRILNLRNNNLKSLPEEISELYNLKELNLSLNQLKNLPKGLNKLTQLEKLILVGNPLNDRDVTALKKALPNTQVYF